MEGVISRVPSFAISTDVRGARQRSPAEPFAVAAELAALVARKIMAQGLPPGVLLNVNVPGLATRRPGRAGHADVPPCLSRRLVERADPRGKPYYWIGGEEPTAEPDEGTDFWALEHGFVSITPLHLDLTAYEQMKRVQDWGLHISDPKPHTPDGNG